ncbi:hypothetical protein BC936DRAFT_148057 [Jimgerdemannia flammicorona]|uniref:Uncharacterized protein n=1 Tax=Jimgerdemannia flammicorona TaxID=994334 RepID=A0A433D3V3_9FUNG|nr:hypothetical protein BC936DRAFT_148057 [Jimgerdemannia flammicorona]
MNETGNSFPGEDSKCQGRSLVCTRNNPFSLTIRLFDSHYPIFYENPSKQWSYLNFLKTNRPEIIKLPPFSTDWTGLNGAWQSRFLSKAKEMPQWNHLNGAEPLGRVSTHPRRAESGVDGTLFFSYHPLCGICGLFFDGLYRQLSAESDDVILSSTVIAIYFAFWLQVPDISKLSLFWLGIIKNRKTASKEIAVATNYEISSLELLDVAREKKKKSIANHIEGVADKVDATSTDGGSRKAAVTSSKRKVANIDDDSGERQSQDSVSEASESDNVSEYVQSDAISDYDDEKLLPSRLECFVESHAGMANSKKWILSSGICIEDKLFSTGNRLSFETLIHSWIIDLDDHEIEKLFTEKEWREI